MNKNRIRLTESQLHGVIKESVKHILSELDYKTYANAAKKRRAQYSDVPSNIELYDKFSELSKMAYQRFDDDYIGDMKYDTFGDKLRGGHSPRYNASFDPAKDDRMAYGAINGYNKSGDKIFSTGKGRYYSNGITTPSKFFRDKEVGSSFERANDELWDYSDGNYEYEPNGQGWHLKDGMDESIRRAIRNVLR